MSNGFTGFVIDEKLKLGWFGRVHVYQLETYESGSSMTSMWHKVNTLRFRNRDEARAYISQYNKRRGR